MGCDIYGWVETKESWEEQWWGVIKIDHLYLLSYGMFGSLFGVRNIAHFKPIAAERGLPEGVSKEVLEDFAKHDFPSISWISLVEIKNINWKEVSEEWPDNVDRFSKDDQGKWVEHGSIDLEEACSLEFLTEDDVQRLQKGLKVRKDDLIYKLRKRKRGEFLYRPHKMLFDFMTKLGKFYGDENVRLVVGFDMP